MSTNRREFLAMTAGLGMSAVLGGFSLPLRAATPLEELMIYGPPAAPSLVLAHLAERGELQGMVKEVGFQVYRNPDQLRTGFVSGRWKVAGTPSYVAANMYNRGIPVRLLNIMTWGLLYLMSRNEQVQKIEDLRGQTVAMFFKNDMPDLVFQALVSHAGMTIGKDIKLQYVTTPLEGVQLLLSGRVDHAVLPEPAATASLLKGLKSTQKIHRTLNLQDAWGVMTGGDKRIPQAGMMIAADLVERQPGIVAALNNAFAQSADWVNNNPSSAGRLGEAYMKVKAPVIEKSVPQSNIQPVTGIKAKPALEKFFSQLAEINPGIIGGKLPAAEFYLG
ncbi:MAG: ABC transporter substrate-binding protein [Chromatiales bacterium]|nr:ABC transporter substrate-binding protein [Chromatiales bacterium]